MLGTSLSMVAAFAAYTAYAIIGDEIRAHRSARTNSSKKSALEIRSTTEKPTNSKKQRAPIPSVNPKKPKAVKTPKPIDPIANAASAILTHLSHNSPITFATLAKELKLDKATILLAAEKLFEDKSAVSIKRGRHPGIAANN